MTTTPSLRSHADLRALDSGALRAVLRAGQYAGTTAGLADGRLQSNIVILPRAQAADFRAFCEANPKPCPLNAITAPGQPAFPGLGRDIDLRSDLPFYHVYRHGVLAERTADITHLWQPDFTGFALGCSFTFERALISAGIPIRHIERGTVVPMYRTGIQTVRRGVFGGPVVMTMRPIRRDRLEEVMQICARFPHAHGTPMHVGDPAGVGLSSLDHPDWGEPVPVAANEIPVFWGCGVTPQVALLEAALPIAITHAPGSMLVTDLDETKVPRPEADTILPTETEET
ncbi:hypothetical protein BV394_04590 [Brevirhabdus pacifica]|uniref:Uncharacterized protein n=1 Tax=Brevirhabdus pacifica TaxID=1267768 RepID=A0A1U7DGI9_9RHOB|nr:putative hydro-lyase [Brevirhabdus pacifica]APX89086.1 hypothetical protein BV394_04590 [Brevirhabdus pacifica]OWU76852.1 hypothetical protein ATO5_11700 [Loktanella sp. 22II-4b]PJJ86334.1 uncharacterized protein YcsI (UPF0317 family) [Brevirhabdus pacifica]